MINYLLHGWTPNWVFYMIAIAAWINFFNWLQTHRSAVRLGKLLDESHAREEETYTKLIQAMPFLVSLMRPSEN